MKILAKIENGKILPEQYSYISKLSGLFVLDITPYIEFTRKQQNSLFGITRRISEETGVSIDDLIKEIEMDTGIENLRYCKLTNSEADKAIKCLLNKAEFRKVNVDEYR